MHTVELLEEAVALAVRAGFGVRQDWFGGAPAGACELKGQKWIFIDLALSAREQLDQVVEALREAPIPPDTTISRQLQALLAPRKAA
ncbi:MAG: hypothetical protein DWQ37_10655 [Planctomycetota bacterium]|nr:MAG: hypothetical protein DWQ37_10655 [Planctomycetota bacterium]